jgi:cellulose synthase/poly-beta-1,6-N-acetylglucosamine synthase-like glycosyltransferase
VILALIPAHNEAERIGHALDGLRGQTARPDRTVVVCDNCADATADVATSTGAEVFATSGNTRKKAGALNQAIAALLPALDDADVVLIQDADTTLSPVFAETAIDRLADPKVGAVGGVFYGEQGGGLLGLLQRSEYVRYGRSIARRGGTVRVLSGTASVFLVATLRAVAQARAAGRIPGGSGVYDTLSLTEDNELTLAVKTLGYRPLSPGACEVETEVMGTVRTLWKQRKRWQRGALENLRNYGWTRVTAPYILRQMLAGASALALSLYLVFAAWSLVLGKGLAPSTLGLLLTGVFVAERALTVRRAGRAAVGVAAILLVELAYDMFQNVVFGACFAGWLKRSKQAW